LGILPACSHAQTPSPKNVLIVYLSRTSNTKVIAEIIQSAIKPMQNRQ
jgi:hypothetical protein